MAVLLMLAEMRIAVEVEVPVFCWKKFLDTETLLAETVNNATGAPIKVKPEIVEPAPV